MIRRCTISSLILSALAMPATAADLSRHGPWYVEAPAPVAGKQPFYLVNQGPEISGPGIMIVGVGYSWTGLSQPYPYIRAVSDRPLVPVTSDYFGTVPIHPAAKIWPPPRVHSRHVHRKAWRRKPIRVRY